MVNQSEKTQKTFLILDGNALLHRAWHAIPPLTTQDGRVVNAVYGFINILEKLLDTHAPTYVAVAWDLPGGTFRHEAEETYKAHREEKEPELYDQIPMIQEVLEGYGIPSLAVPGFEADDILGTIAHQFANRDIHCLIATGDHDTMQLVNKHVSVLIFVKGVSQTKIYSPKEVVERFGVMPEQMIDYKVLVGDASDNIKGFPGIGPKTAAEILQAYESLDGVMQEAEAGLLPKKWQRRFEPIKEIRQSIEDLRLLVTIRTDVKIPKKISEYAPHIDQELLHAQFEDLEFKTLALKYANHRTDTGKTVTQDASLSPLVAYKDLKITDRTWFVLLSDEGFLVGDGVQVARATEKQIKDLIAQKIVIVTHDAKGILHMLHASNINATFFDVILGAYILESNTRAYTLNAIAGDFLSKKYVNASDMEQLVALHKEFSKRLAEDGLERIATLEQEVLPVLYRMESFGIAIDLLALKDLSKNMDHEITKLEKKIYRLAGREFNIQSPSQLAVVLFEDLQLPTKGIKKTKTGYSTRASELEKLWETHAIIEHVSEYREVTKLKSTYIDALPSYADKDSRIHTTFNQTGTVTGRLSSTDPNLQNIPIRTDLGNMVREAFVADKGYKLVSIDYSQIELRLIADIANDQALLEAFDAGEDIHTVTAARVFGKDSAHVTHEERRQAKAINFGILYGMGSRSLAKATHVSQTEATSFMEKYFQIHAGVATYIEEIKKFAHDHEYVKTAWGRRRYLHEINSGIPMLIAAAERMAMNTPIQGSKADVVKQAMIDVDAWIRTQKEDIRMLLQVHDELVFEIPERIIHDVVPHITKMMESAWNGRVNLVVHCKIGASWGKMTSL